MDGRPQLLVAVLAILVVAGSASFAIDATGEEVEPVAFKGTNEGGLAAGAVYQAQQTDTVIPRAEAFYAQYQSVVGYYGIPFLVEDLHRSAQSREFGRLLTVYVSDFTDSGVGLNSDSMLTVSSGRDTEWTRARNASFVVDSRARTSGNTKAVVPFSDRRSARDFAHRYNGTVVGWSALRNRRYGELERTQQEWDRRIAQRQRWANRTATRAQDLGSMVGPQAQTLEYGA